MPKYSPSPENRPSRSAPPPKTRTVRPPWVIGTAVGLLVLFAAIVALRPPGSEDATTSTTAAQTSDGKQVFAAIAERYRKMRSYAEHVDIRLRLPVGGELVEQVTQVDQAIELPNRVAVRVQRDAQGVQLISDGKQLVATVADVDSENFGNQYVQQPSPDKLSATSLYAATEYTDVSRPNELLSLFMDFPLDMQVTPFGLLMSDEAWKQMLANATTFTALPDEMIETDMCHRWRVSTPAGDFVFALTIETGLIRRIEYPVARLLPPDAPVELRTQASFVSDHRNVRADVALSGDTFSATIPAAGRKMRHFVLPMSEKAPQALHLHPDPFAFTDLDGAQVESSTWKDQICVLVWFNDHPASQAVVTQVDRVRAQLAKDSPVSFLAVCADPPTEKGDRDVSEIGRRWRLTLPLARDLEAVGRDIFHIEQAPTLVVLNREGVVQLVEVGANPDLERQLPVVLEKLIAGDDIAADFIKYIDDQEKAHDMLMATASWDAPTQEIELVEAVIAPRSEPEFFSLERAWRQREVKSAGNILVVSDGAAPPQLIVNSGWADVAVLNVAGEIDKQQSLTADREVVVSRFRTATNRQGNRFFVGTSALGKSVFLFDENFQHQLSYPATDQEHAGIHDVWLTDIDQDGTLELYVGFAGVVGLHAVDLDGTRRWANRSISPVLSLTEVTSENTRMLLVTGASGEIDRVDGAGRKQSPVSVGQRVIHHVFASLAREARPTQLCGLSSLPSGQLVAIGLTPSASEAWSYPLPRGNSASQIQYVVSGQVFADDQWDWLFAGPDGSIHIVSDDGQRHDRFHYGKQLQGLAAIRVEGRTLLVVSTDEGVDGWWLTPKP